MPMVAVYPLTRDFLMARATTSLVRTAPGRPRNKGRPDLSLVVDDGPPITSCATRASRASARPSRRRTSSSSGSARQSGADHGRRHPSPMADSERLTGAEIRQINLSSAHASAASQFSVERRWLSRDSIAPSESLSMFSQYSICPALKKKH